MNRNGFGLILVGILVMVGLATAATPAALAQDPFTPEEQAALDTVRTALLDFVTRDAYTASLEMLITQDMSITYLDQTAALLQTVNMAGTIDMDRAQSRRHTQIAQTLTQTIGIGANSDTTKIGPLVIEMIVVDDRTYLKFDAPADLAEFIPSGWHDITEGANAFPGMDMFDIEGLMAFDELAGPSFVIDLLEAAQTVSIDEPETVGADPVIRYVFDLDPELVLASITSETLVGMFDADQVPFDVPALIDLMYADKGTAFELEVVLGRDDDRLISFSYLSGMDVLIEGDLITDPSLEGASITLEQTSRQRVSPDDLNPVLDIQAPPLE
jgi:hypothetical protein